MFVRRRKLLAFNPAEHRYHQRVNLEADVTVDSDHNFYCGFGENISEGGLFISTYRLMELGTELDLTFTLPGFGPFEVRGRVQWIREHSILNNELPPGLGLLFLNPSQNLLAAVRSFVAEREPTFYD